MIVFSSVLFVVPFLSPYSLRSIPREMDVNMGDQPSVDFAKPWSPESLPENGLTSKKQTNNKPRRSTTAEVLQMVNDHQVNPELGNHYFVCTSQAFVSLLY